MLLPNTRLEVVESDILSLVLDIKVLLELVVLITSIDDELLVDVDTRIVELEKVESSKVLRVLVVKVVPGNEVELGLPSDVSWDPVVLIIEKMLVVS